MTRLLRRLHKIPPCACRLVAKVRHGRGWRGLSHREVAILSGIPKSTVAKITYRKSWKGIAIDVVDAFCEACGVDPLQANRTLYFLRNRKLAHTEAGSTTQLKMYIRLWKLYAEFTQEAQQS